MTSEYLFFHGAGAVTSICIENELRETEAETCLAASLGLPI